MQKQKHHITYIHTYIIFIHILQICTYVRTLEHQSKRERMNERKQQNKKENIRSETKIIIKTKTRAKESKK